MRVFIALELDREVVNEIKKIQNLIKKQSLFNGKFTESENLHLTLKFLGEISEEKAGEIKKRLKNIKIKNFNCEIGDIGVFNKSFIRIIWIKLNGKGVFNLQKEIDEKLSDLLEKEERFMSHITIARVNYIKDKKGLLDYLDSIKPKKLKFTVNSFSLKKSELFPEGPVYETLEEYNLEE